jgi:PAS domain S-box-containing protein
MVIPMTDQSKTKQELIQELVSLRRKIRELEDSESEHKQMEDMLRQSEEQCRTILNTAQDGFWLVDAATGRLIDVNEASSSMLGYNREELLTRVITDIDVQWSSKEIDREMQKIKETGNAIFETRHRTKSGQVIDVEISINYLPATDQFFLFIRDITGRRLARRAAREQEEQKEYGLDGLLSLGKDVTEEEIRQIVDFEAIQELMNFFNKLTHIGIGIIDLQGNILVATGWQDICTKFHRIHPRTLKNCIECDTCLTRNVEEGKYIVYKCKNNLWDQAIPIIIGDRHIANLFLGQFFFADEEPDYELFRKQAEIYGFDIDEYLAALDRVPRWSRETVETVMEFYTKFAAMVSRLSLGNIRLSRSLLEQKRVEEALRETKRRLADIIEFLPDATLVIDRKGAVIAWNRAMEFMTGVKAEDILGKRNHEYSLPFYGKRRPILIDLVFISREEIAKKYSSVKREGDILLAEAVDVPIRGVPTALSGAARPLYDSKGNIVGAIESIRDISERKQAEELLKRSEANYRSVIENIQDIFYRSDPQGHLIMASPSFLTLLEYESFDDCLGKPMASFNHDPVKRAEFLRQLLDKGSVQNYELVLKRRDGTPVIVETNSHSYFDGAGNVAGIEGTFRDITERKQAEEDRKKLESRLIQAQKMEAIGTLAGGIAHDFNNILSAIMGYTELYQDAVRDQPKVYEHTKQVLSAANRAKDLVKQILAFSRKSEHEKKPIILSPIVKEVVKFLRASLPTTIEIKQRINENLDAIMADPTQMHQVLMNLCTNAGHAMKETGGILEIGLKEAVIHADNLLRHPALKSGRYLELCIRDTGHGISQENQEKIFEPYFTTKEKGEGTGLGLAVVHGIVKDHGGEISVYSEVGKGTIFRAYLPLIEKKAEGKKDVEEAVPWGKGETILYIDDEHMIVDASRQVMEQLGYKVVTETDPVKAIELFKAGRDTFDLVITDKTMPHLTGFDLAREIRRIRADIPLLICSGFQEKEDMEKLKILGISRLISKPIRKFTLAKAIRDVLDKD